MSEANRGHAAMLDGARAYTVDVGTQRVNWFLIIGSAVFAVGFAGFGIFWTSSTFTQILSGIVAIALIFFALYSVRYNQLATLLYPDRIVSRGLLTQASLQRDDIAGFELIPERSGPPTLRLAPKDPTHKALRINRFTHDDAFRDWLSGIPDLRLTPSAIRRKRRLNFLVVLVFGLGWSALLFFGLRQSLYQYREFLHLQSRGLTVNGEITGKYISNSHQAKYIIYAYIVKYGLNSKILNGKIEVNENIYDITSVGNEVPVVYDSRDIAVSYPNPNGLLSRIDPRADLIHGLEFYAVLTLGMIALMAFAWVAESKAAKKPLP